MAADSISSAFPAAFVVLQELLACPACEGELRLEADRLLCVRCGMAYRIVDGIPVLTPQGLLRD